MENQWRQFNVYFPYIVDRTVYLVDTRHKMMFNANDIIESGFEQYNVVTGDYTPLVSRTLASMTHYDSNTLKVVPMHVQYIIVKLEKYYDTKYMIHSIYLKSRNDTINNPHKFYIVPK